MSPDWPSASSSRACSTAAPSPNDRRAQIVSLTAEGRRAFRAMARTHEDWIAEIFAGLGADEIDTLMNLLAKTKASARKARDRAEALDDRAIPSRCRSRTTRRSMCGLTVDGKVATLTLNRPDKKNPLTFESYAEIANIFRAAAKDKQVKAFVITGEGGNFCSGGDVFEIIGPLVEMNTVDLLEFTRMTGEAVKAMRAVPAADRRGDRRRLRRRGRDPRDGVRPADRHRQGQGRVPVQSRRACRLRHGRLRDPAAHHRPGPRVGAALHRPRDGRRGSRALGLLQPARRRPKRCSPRRRKLAHELADGPTFANAMTKRMLEMEWAMSVEQAIEAEAVAQALCMETEDFARAFRAFAAKQKPVFEGN